MDAKLQDAINKLPVIQKVHIYEPTIWDVAELYYKEGQQNGRQEVVEWLRRNTASSLKDKGRLRLFQVDEWGWQAQLEKWGIDKPPEQKEVCTCDNAIWVTSYRDKPTEQKQVEKCPVCGEMVEELEVIPKEHELPTIDQFVGSDPNYTGDMTTKEYIQSIRSGKPSSRSGG